MFAAAFVLTIGMTQCRKDNDLNAPSNEGHTVHITVNVGDGGSKGRVNPATGEIGFTSGDELYVGYNNAYVGTLTTLQALSVATSSSVSRGRRNCTSTTLVAA